MTFDMSEAWRDATAMIKANREVLLVVAGIFFFLPSLAAGLAMPNMEAMFSDPAALEEQMLAFYADWGWLMVLILLVQVAGCLALLTLLRDRSRPTVGQAISAGFKGLLPAIGVGLVVLLATIFAGALFGMLVAALSLALGATASTLIGGVAGVALLGFCIYASIKLSLWTPVIAVEKVYNPVAVLRRSWRITKGNTLQLLAFYLLLGIVYVVISLLAGMIIGALALVLGDTMGLIVSAILSGLIGSAATVIFVAVQAAAHRQLSSPWAATERQGDTAD